MLFSFNNTEETYNKAVRLSKISELIETDSFMDYISDYTDYLAMIFCADEETMLNFCIHEAFNKYDYNQFKEELIRRNIIFSKELFSSRIEFVNNDSSKEYKTFNENVTEIIFSFYLEKAILNDIIFEAFSAYCAANHVFDMAVSDWTCIYDIESLESDLQEVLASLTTINQKTARTEICIFFYKEDKHPGYSRISIWIDEPTKEG